MSRIGKSEKQDWEGLGKEEQERGRGQWLPRDSQNCPQHRREAHTPSECHTMSCPRPGACVCSPCLNNAIFKTRWINNYINMIQN